MAEEIVPTQMYNLKNDRRIHVLSQSVSAVNLFGLETSNRRGRRSHIFYLYLSN